jgi:hypothetical protein
LVENGNFWLLMDDTGNRFLDNVFEYWLAMTNDTYWRVLCGLPAGYAEPSPATAGRAMLRSDAAP